MNERKKRSSKGSKLPTARRDKVGARADRALAKGNVSTTLASSRSGSGVSARPERMVVTLHEQPTTGRSEDPEIRSERRSVATQWGRTLRIALTVPPHSVSEPDVEELDVPSENEVNRAVDTLVRLSAARAGEEWERAVDGLQDSPFLDTDRLYQAQQHAALRRWVLDEVELLGPGEIAELLPHRVGTDSNVGRAVDKRRERGELLAVPYKDVWRYPSSQISATGDVHAPIPDVVARARAQGYDPWEIVYRLARPIVTPPAVLVGHPLRHGAKTLSLDELFAAAGKFVLDSAAAESQCADVGSSPFEMLAAGDGDAFERAVRDWLGPDAP